MALKFKNTHLPCPDCGSSDALAINDDGSTKCFSCGTFNPKAHIYNNILYNNSLVAIDNYKKEIAIVNNNIEFIPFRGLTTDTLKHYQVGVFVAPNGEQCVRFPYNGGEGYKIRPLNRKEFYSEGTMRNAGLFGKERFGRGTAQAITITEGEIDAMSVFQMLGSKYPVVSVRGSASAKADCERDFDYLNAFDKIYICFDNDKVGQEAVKEVASLFDVNKVYHVKLDKYKDANEYLQNHAVKEFVSQWWNAKTYRPKNVISSYNEIEELLNSPEPPALCSFPFPTLDGLSYGIRSGEITLVTAQEKIGKTEFLRAIEYHVLKNTDYKIGVIHLEEKEKRAVQGLITYEVGAPVHLPDCAISKQDQIEAYKALTRSDDRVHFYTHFGSDDPNNILETIRFMVAGNGCKLIFLDHITMLVTGFEGDDERKKLDYISTRLAMMTRELDFALIMVSHVNDDGKTRGSRNIGKVADLLVHLDRDVEADSAEERNKTRVTIRGNRFAGTSGPAGVLTFDPKTFRLSEYEHPVDFGDTSP